MLWGLAGEGARVSDILSAETMKAHQATWWVWAGNVKIRRTGTMRGPWGYDVTCSCGGFETNTGGATRRYIESELWFHRYQAQEAAAPSPFVSDPQIPGALPGLP